LKIDKYSAQFTEDLKISVYWVSNSLGGIFRKNAVRPSKDTLNIQKYAALSYIAPETISDDGTLDDFLRIRQLEPLKNLGIR
jgi:hypothetical protein